MRQRPFETWHPLVPALYFAGTITLAMFGINPACVIISLVGSMLLSLSLHGLASSLAKLRWQLPLLVLICLVNPLYSAMGSTLIARVGPVRVYAESLAYGAVMGALLVSVLLWFEAAAGVVGEDEVLELGGGLLPSVALALSMVMRLIPLLMQRARMVRDVVRATIGPAQGRREAVRLLGVLLTWSLEDSVERSDSMRARGWGAVRRRTTFRTHVVRMYDVVAAILLLLLLAGSAWGVWRTVSGWRFYPRMKGEAPWVMLAPYVALVLLPTVLLLVERWGRCVDDID